METRRDVKNPLGWFLGLVLILAFVYILLSLLHENADLRAQRDAAQETVQQITTQKQGVPGVDGEDGESAYEIAVRLGFVGTEQEWLASLVGPRGTAGSNGAAGAPGGYSTLDIQCLSNHWKVVVNGVVTRDLNVYCF